MRILFTGDVVGKPGRKLLAAQWSRLRAEQQVDFTIVNAENASGGVGLTPANAEELFALGADVLTLGNHAWDKHELLGRIDEFPRLLRPLNYPIGTPGQGALVCKSKGGLSVGVINAMGRVFAGVHLDCPFRTVLEAATELAAKTKVIVVDFHAEATSEKVCMGWFLDGKVSAVIGTHTHVQTADACVLPGGTAYITDVGMTGPWMSSLGVDRHQAIDRFMTQMPTHFEVASGPSQYNGVVIDVDETSGWTRSIERLHFRQPWDSL